MTVTAFNRPVAAAIIEEALAALQPLAKKHGLDVQRSRAAKFTETSLSVGVEFVVRDKNGTALSEDLRALRLVAVLLGLEQEDLDKIYYHPRLGQIKFVGYRPTAWKRPVTINTVPGNRPYVITMESARGIVAQSRKVRGRS